MEKHSVVRVLSGKYANKHGNLQNYTYDKNGRCNGADLHIRLDSFTSVKYHSTLNNFITRW